jgi:uncharacterized cupin superfamily protein
LPPPYQASNPHGHPGSVFAYVLEGEVVSQLADGKPVTYKQGGSWYETPLIARSLAQRQRHQAGQAAGLHDAGRGRPSCHFVR